MRCCQPTASVRTTLYDVPPATELCVLFYSCNQYILLIKITISDMYTNQAILHRFPVVQVENDFESKCHWIFEGKFLLGRLCYLLCQQGWKQQKN